MFFSTLSGRFLTLTAVFVVIAEVLFFVPSMARFRYDYLQARLDLGQMAALTVLAMPPDQEVPADLQQKLLNAAGVLNIALRRNDVRELMVSSPTPPTVQGSYNLLTDTSLDLMHDALRVFLRGGDRIVRVIGSTSQGGEVEITMHEQPLREAMVKQGRRILYISLAISLATATLLFLAVQRLIVRPISRVVTAMTTYRDDPEDSSRIISPESGAREIREAEAALQDLEVRLTAALKQKERLAGLGGAVAKISHDLRNMLATAQITADRIETSADPAVARAVPKLVAALSRAINLCERTLAYGKAEELPPVPAVFALRPLVLEVLESESATAPARCTGLEAEVPRHDARPRRLRSAVPRPLQPRPQRRPGDRGRRRAGPDRDPRARDRWPQRDPRRSTPARACR